MISTPCRKKPYVWLSDEVWLNIIELSSKVPFFRSLPEDLIRSETAWKAWYDSNSPEEEPVPDIEPRIKEDPSLGPWYRLLAIRTFRLDRTKLTIRKFISLTEDMGPRYIEPVTDTIDSVYEKMTNDIPVIFLLSVGADPTASISELARRKKINLAQISMGEGQAPRALKAIKVGSTAGSWVLLQNCELGLDLMITFEHFIKDNCKSWDEGFRLFLTAAPDASFPLRASSNVHEGHK